MEETPTEPADPMHEGMEGLIAAMKARKPVPPADELGNASTLLASASGEDDALAEAPWHAVGLPSESEHGQRAHAMMLERGAVVGRYVVLRTLGAGGMGVVHAAYDPELDRKLALKLLLPGVGGAGGRTRLLREAQALAKLAHPNVVAIHDVGTIGEQVWLAMEFVQGRTLSAWLEEPRRWLEVVRTLRRAGEGLVAAHAAGLLHRDFKPDNVMIGDDGRVRVMDFGLARVGEHAERRGPDESRVMPVLDTLAMRVTQEGTILGTPSYMPPEQFGSTELTAAADQFAFCVTLWEALYGERPFAGSSWMELAANVLGGRLRSPTKGRGVPGWLRRACERGLSADPQQRWPSMSALLETLARGRLRAGARKGAVVLGGLALLGTGVVAEREYGLAQRTAACEASGDEIESAWSPVREQALRDGLMATGVSYAATTADHAIPWLEQQAAAWRGARVDACLDTDVHGRWSTNTLDRSLWCLDERRAELESLVDERTRADAEVLQKAVTAAAALSSVDPCRDPRVLAVLPPPPAEEREAIRAVRASVTRAGNLERAGRYDEGLELASAAFGRADVLAWRPLAAMARLQQGSLLMMTADYPAAEKALEAAYSAAIEGGAPEVSVGAATLLVRVVGYDQARYAEGRLWGRLAEVALAELEGDQRLRRADLLGELAGVQAATGDYDRAKASDVQVLAIREQVLGPDHPEVAETLHALASVYGKLGDYEQAKRLHERALAIHEKAQGPEHPDVAWSIDSLARIHRITGDYEEAKRLHEQALGIRKVALGPNHPDVASSLEGIAASHKELGNYEEAKALYEQSLAIDEAALGSKHPDIARSFSNLAGVHKALGDYEQAKALYERALVIAEEAQGPEHPDVAEILNNLGAIQKALRDYAGAEGRYERARSIFEETLGPQHPNVAACLTNLAGILGERGAFDEAAALHERAIAIFEKALGPEHLDVARALNNLALIRERSGRHTEAIAAYERSIAIKEEALGANHSSVAQSLYNLALVHGKLGANDEAIALHARAIAIYEASLGSEHPLLATSLVALAELEITRGRAGEAVAPAQRAVVMREHEDLPGKGLADARFVLAYALWSAPVGSGRDRARAMALIDRAREDYRGLGEGGAEDLAELEGWLREHARDR